MASVVIGNNLWRAKVIRIIKELFAPFRLLRYDIKKEQRA
jgi:hypothetical protein